MKRFVFSIALSFLVAGSADALQWGVKAGGGVNFKPSPSRWGGHGSVEIPLSEDYPTSLSAFFEMYRKSGITQMPIGLSIHYKAALSRYGGTIYFAGGGGLLRVSGLGNSANNGMITVAGGTVFGLTESIDLFGQFRWFKAFASGSVNEYGIQAGFHFPLGRE
ncbi:TPA: hypothetical protein DCE37_13435 [Candidatus Latescibacteria bacterium]|nr:hypothetical protein [Gemmatimonadota bacterium]HAA76112.1 hypothetical protein [Candidatus Latescibacterota bacterium]|tara:strand:+ start:1741 stop:2229 length:489 start_codon:yes stop_codon:yes gene_type:complete